MGGGGGAAVREAVTGVVPSPRSKVTVPVGVPAPGARGATAAVNVTGWPTTDGSGDELTAVVVEARFTVWVSVPLEPANAIVSS